MNGGEVASSLVHISSRLKKKHWELSAPESEICQGYDLQCRVQSSQISWSPPCWTRAWKNTLIRLLDWLVTDQSATLIFSIRAWPLMSMHTVDAWIIPSSRSGGSRRSKIRPKNYSYKTRMCALGKLPRIGSRRYAGKGSSLSLRIRGEKSSYRPCSTSSFVAQLLITRTSASLRIWQWWQQRSLWRIVEHAVHNSLAWFMNPNSRVWWMFEENIILGVRIHMTNTF